MILVSGLLFGPPVELDAVAFKCRSLTRISRVAY